MRFAPVYRVRCWIGQHPIHVTFTFHLANTSRVSLCRCCRRVVRAEVLK